MILMMATYENLILLFQNVGISLNSNQNFYLHMFMAGSVPILSRNARWLRLCCKGFQFCEDAHVVGVLMFWLKYNSSSKGYEGCVRQEKSNHWSVTFCL